MSSKLSDLDILLDIPADDGWVHPKNGGYSFKIYSVNNLTVPLTWTKAPSTAYVSAKDYKEYFENAK